MGENDKNFIQYVGRVLFPRDPADLRSVVQCPACFTQLRGSICHSCQLDLNHPAAPQLSAASNRAADALDERLEIIGRMRYETDQLIAQRAARVDAPAASVDAAAAAVTPPPSPAAQLPLPAKAPAATAATAATATIIRPPATDRPGPGPIPAAPRRSTVQVMLVVVGISLLSIFAIFGLVWAFITYGVEVRSIIIGSITVAALITASALRRRRLVATGEGIAAFGAVLVYLDVWAIRVNDFFGLASSNESTYWGVALLVTSLGFLGWHRLSSMRVPSVAAHAALVPAAGLVTAGLLEGSSVDAGSILFVATLAAAVVGLAHRVTVSRQAGAAERILLVAATGIALLFSAGAAWAVVPESDWAASIALVAVAAVALAHGYALLSLPGSTAAWHTAAAVFTGFGAFNAALAAPAVGFRTGDSAVLVIAPALAALVIALVFESGWRRMKHTAAAPSMLTGAITAGSVAAFAALASTVTAIPPLTDALAAARYPWSLSAFDELVVPTSLSTEALIGVAVAVAALGLGWAALRVLATRGHLLMYAAVVVVMLAVPQLRGALPIALGFAALGAIALGTLVWSRALPRNYRPPLLLLLAASTTVSYAVGWADRDAWWTTVVSTVLLLVASRALSRDTTVRAALFGGATVIALTGVAGAGSRIAEQGAEFPPNALMALAAGALLVFAAPRIPLRSGSLNSGSLSSGSLSSGSLSSGSLLSNADRLTTFWIATVIGLAAMIPVWAPTISVSGAIGMSIGTAGVLLGFLVWLALPATHEFAAPRIVAGIALSPVAAWLAWNVALAWQLPALGLAIAPLVAVVVVTAAALGWQLARGQARRWPTDAGSAVAGVVVIGMSLASGVPELWLVLLLGAVALLLGSANRDGIVGSTSERKHVGWFSLALATAALWLRLVESSVRDLEPYVLPLAGVLLIIGLLAWRSGERTHAGHPSRGAPHLLMSGLLVAIVPLALVSGTGPIERPLIVGGVSALVLLIGTLPRENVDVQPYLNAVAIAGGSGVVLVAGARALELLRTNPQNVDGRVEAWVVSAAVLLVIAAVGIARTGASRQREQFADGLVMASLIAVAALETAAASTSDVGTVRAIALVLLLSAAHVLTFWWNRAPFPRAAAWTALVLAAITSTVFVVTGVVDPFEYVFVPVALALLGSGSIRLGTVPTARSWPWLSPGLLVLLVPSLVALYVDEPLWRVVGVGVIATICIIVGAVRRLQAPFLIGIVVLLVHLVTQLWPGIRFVYEQTEWWLWLGIAGVVVIFLAATYERRIRNFRSVAMRIGALR